MRICVFGAGSVGGYLAGFLARSGAEVSVVARGAHLAAIRANRLMVETPDDSLSVRIAASDNPADLGPQDVVFVTTKVPALPDVARSIAPLLRAETAVAFITNGIPWWYFHKLPGPTAERRIGLLDPDGSLWRLIGPERAIGGIFWPACSVPAPGVVRLLTGAGRGTVFGEPDGRTTPRIRAIADSFRAAALPVTIADDIRTLIWQKLVFNLSAGPLCVLTETPVAATQTEPALVACSSRLVTEGVAIARAMGIRLEIDPEQVARTNKALQHRPSILQDLQAGRPMEIDALYGVALELAELHGVPAPTLELIAALIQVKARARGLYPA